MPRLPRNAEDLLARELRSCGAKDIVERPVTLSFTGTLETAYRASSSVPMVVTPIKVGERVLVDCGVADPVPAEVVLDMGADLIVAVNTDPAAPIFGVAKYGTTVDLLDLAPALSEQVRQAKGG